MNLEKILSKEKDILKTLKLVVDPELMMNIVDLGLVYRAEDVGDFIEVDYTLTSPACPVGDYIAFKIVSNVEKAHGKKCKAELVWTPPWDPETMSEEAKLVLGFDI